jgi:hypothetical protein
MTPQPHPRAARSLEENPHAAGRSRLAQRVIPAAADEGLAPGLTPDEVVAGAAEYLVRGTECRDHEGVRGLHCITVPRSRNEQGEIMAKKTVLVSDKSGKEIEEGKGAKVRISFNDARKGVRELDLTDEEAMQLGGRTVARRGRRPKSQS